MKYAILFLAIILASTTAHAATFVSVTPTVVKEKVISWEYTFSFKSSPLAPSEIVYGHQDACDRPLSRVTGQPLLPVPIMCWKTEVEARAEAQKEADVFEVNCRHEPSCSTFKIEATKLKQKLGIQ